MGTFGMIFYTWRSLSDSSNIACQAGKILFLGLVLYGKKRLGVQILLLDFLLLPWTEYRPVYCPQYKYGQRRGEGRFFDLRSLIAVWFLEL